MNPYRKDVRARAPVIFLTPAWPLEGLLRRAALDHVPKHFADPEAFSAATMIGAVDEFADRERAKTPDAQTMIALSGFGHFNVQGFYFGESLFKRHLEVGMMAGGEDISAFRMRHGD